MFFDLLIVGFVLCVVCSIENPLNLKIYNLYIETHSINAGNCKHWCKDYIHLHNNASGESQRKLMELATLLVISLCWGMKRDRITRLTCKFQSFIHTHTQRVSGKRCDICLQSIRLCICECVWKCIRICFLFASSRLVNCHKRRGSLLF